MGTARAPVAVPSFQMVRALHVGLILALLIPWLLPLARAVESPCGHCVSRCCCRLPGASQPYAPGLALSCPGAGSMEPALLSLWPPAVIPGGAPLAEAGPAAAAPPRGCRQSGEGAPDPLVPPPRTSPSA